MSQKITKRKYAVTRKLRIKSKKHGKYIIKSVVNVNKGTTFAPATAIDVHRNTDRPTNLN